LAEDREGAHIQWALRFERLRYPTRIADFCLTAYEEDDNGFAFSRNRSKRTKATTLPEPAQATAQAVPSHTLDQASAQDASAMPPPS